MGYLLNLWRTQAGFAIDKSFRGEGLLESILDLLHSAVRDVLDESKTLDIQIWTGFDNASIMPNTLMQVFK